MLSVSRAEIATAIEEATTPIAGGEPAKIDSGKVSRRRPVSNARSRVGGTILTDVAAMYDASLPSTRTGCLYNAFSYPTKISPEVIALFIATHTRPGDSVADVFAGSGSTGLAALLCERPTPAMKTLAERLSVKPNWGPRSAHLFDVGTLGCFIARVMTSPPDPDEFFVAADEFIAKVAKRLGGLYATKDDRGLPGMIRHVVWSEVVICDQCGQRMRLWDVAVEHKPARFTSSVACTRCDAVSKSEDLARAKVRTIDVFGRETTTRLRVPVEVHGTTAGRRWKRAAKPCDEKQADRWRDIILPAGTPDVAIRWGELRRSGYHEGLDKLHHFYTPRNFTAMAVCMDEARRWPEPMASALKFLALSYNATHSTLMTRIVAKTGQSDFVLTGAQSGVLYVSGLPVEKNIVNGLIRKKKTIADAFGLIHGTKGTVTVHNRSSESLPLTSGSVAYVFTDPPFGDYIPYAELNQINEAWLGSLTDRVAETVVSKSGGKNEAHYQRSMSKIFREVRRVLKKDGLATVVFHSAHSRIWRALTEAFASAPLHVRRANVLDKIQASFKQTVSKVSVKGDPLMLLGKSPSLTKPAHSDIVERLAASCLPEGNVDVRALFSRYAAACLEAGERVELDAVTFRERIGSAMSATS